MRALEILRCLSSKAYCLFDYNTLSKSTLFQSYCEQSVYLGTKKVSKRHMHLVDIF
jgi:hypothetical protein